MNVCLLEFIIGVIEDKIWEQIEYCNKAKERAAHVITIERRGGKVGKTAVNSATEELMRTSVIKASMDFNENERLRNLLGGPE